MDFDFKIHNITEWNNLLSILEKDSIDDIIMKANEECDLILTPKQYTHYKKKFTKTRMKDLLERKNYEELTDVIVHNSEETRQKKITMNMIKKRNFCKYYFCCLWICMDRDYVDYENVLVKLPVMSLVDSINVPPAAIEKFINSEEEDTFKLIGTVVE